VLVGTGSVATIKIASTTRDGSGTRSIGVVTAFLR